MNDFATEKLANDFRTLLDDVEELIKTTAKQTGESVADLRQRLVTRLDEGKKTLAEQERALRERAGQVKASTETYVRENPWTAAGVAAGIGLVLGLLLRRN